MSGWIATWPFSPLLLIEVIADRILCFPGQRSTIPRSWTINTSTFFIPISWDIWGTGQLFFLLHAVNWCGKISHSWWTFPQACYCECMWYMCWSVCTVYCTWLFTLFLCHRFLRSPGLNYEFWAVVKPTNGAVALFLALHTCDVVSRRRDFVIFFVLNQTATFTYSLLSLYCQPLSLALTPLDWFFNILVYFVRFQAISDLSFSQVFYLNSKEICWIVIHKYGYP
jgi:hypothetical protein